MENLPDIPGPDDWRPDDLLPENWYDAVILGCEIRENKAANGHHLFLRYRVTAGDFTGREFTGRISIAHDRPEVEAIGRRVLAELLRAADAVGSGRPDDLIGRHLGVKVIVRAGTNGYRDSNDAKGYRACKSRAAEAAKAAYQAAAKGD